MTEKIIFVLGTVENNVGKGENTGYQHGISKRLLLQGLSVGIVLKGLTLYQTTNFWT